MDLGLTSVPEIEIDNARDRAHFEESWHVLHLVPRLKGYMAFPSSEEARAEALVTWWAFSLHQVAKSQLSPTAKEALHASIMREFDKLGGHAAVARARGSSYFDGQIEKAARNGGNLAGQVLTVARSIDTNHRDVGRGGASIRKATEVIAVVESSNRDKVNKAWIGFGEVSHLWAAFRTIATRLLATDQRSLSPILHPPLLYGLLAWSRDYELWGSTFRPHGRVEPLLANPWRLPEFVKYLPNTPTPIPPLDDAYLSALKDYKAPASES